MSGDNLSQVESLNDTSSDAIPLNKAEDESLALNVRHSMVQEIEHVVFEGKRPARRVPTPDLQKGETAIVPGGLTPPQDIHAAQPVTGRDVNRLFKTLDLRCEGAEWESFAEPRVNPKAKDWLKKVGPPSKPDVLLVLPDEIRIRLHGVDLEKGGAVLMDCPAPQEEEERRQVPGLVIEAPVELPSVDPESDSDENVPILIIPDQDQPEETKAA